MVTPGWYADPAGRYPYRYWDGARWTDHVSSPAGQGTDPLVPAPPAASGSTAPSHQPVRCDPAELHGVLAELGIQPMPPGDGTPFGEPMLVLAFSADRPDALEWWTPSGLLVAVATVSDKQQPGSMDVPNTDPGSGAMIGSRFEVTGADGTPIATTTRTLKPTKPPTYIDVPQGRRIASVAQEKVFSKIPSHAVTAADGSPLGRFVGTEMRGRTMVLSDPAGRPLSNVVKHGKWDGANVALEFARNRPLQTPSQWLANRAVSALMPIKRERICSVAIQTGPPAEATQALLTFLAPLLLEHTLSVL